MSAAKPVDLTEARDLARRLDVFDMPGTAEMMRAMADEIERLRTALRGELDGGDLENCGPRPDLWALLPDEAPRREDAKRELGLLPYPGGPPIHPPPSDAPNDFPRWEHQK
jgi:hypothetical protein